MFMVNLWVKPLFLLLVGIDIAGGGTRSMGSMSSTSSPDHPFGIPSSLNR
jgi:hypothetical protein